MPTIPPIKSQGIKTKLIPTINTLIPHNFDGLWIEPFMGTGVVGFNCPVQNLILSDNNPHLINFYQALQSEDITSLIVRNFLEREGSLLLSNGEEHYYKIRQRFNNYHSPLDFLFLNRAGFNGMIRFNKKGNFNIPFCRKPRRFSRAYVTKIVNQVEAITRIMKEKNISFLCQSFEKTMREADTNSLIYCDPPYIGRHTDYYNTWSEKEEIKLFDCLNKTQSLFILSTWHHNLHRKNQYIDLLWKNFNILTCEHFYFVGGKEKNRGSMTEALVTNYKIETLSQKDQKIPRQLELF